VKPNRFSTGAGQQAWRFSPRADAPSNLHLNRFSTGAGQQAWCFSPRADAPANLYPNRFSTGAGHQAWRFSPRANARPTFTQTGFQPVQDFVFESTSFKYMGSL